MSPMDHADEDTPVETDAFFLVAFMENDDGELSMEAVGDLDDPEQRACVLSGLQGLIERIENLHNHGQTTLN